MVIRLFEWPVIYSLLRLGDFRPCAEPHAPYRWHCEFSTRRSHISRATQRKVLYKMILNKPGRLIAVAAFASPTNSQLGLLPHRASPRALASPTVSTAPTRWRYGWTPPVRSDAGGSDAREDDAVNAQAVHDRADRHGAHHRERAAAAGRGDHHRAAGRHRASRWRAHREGNGDAHIELTRRGRAHVDGRGRCANQDGVLLPGMFGGCTSSAIWTARTSKGEPCVRQSGSMARFSFGRVLVEDPLRCEGVRISQ